MIRLLIIYCFFSVSLLAQSSSSHEHKFNIFKSNYQLKDNHSIAIDQASVASLYLLAPNEIAIPIYFKNKSHQIVLKRFNLFSENFKIETSSGENILSSPIYTYRGKISDLNSFATLTIGENCFALTFSDEHSNYEINQSFKDKKYYFHIADDNLSHHCDTKDEEHHLETKPTHNRASYADCLELYVECDFAAYQTLGSNSSNVQAWATSIFNNLATLYNNYDVPISVSQIFVWTSNADGYATATNLTQMRTTFVNRLTNINLSGKIGYLLSTKPIAGGISYGIGGYCNSITSYPGPAALSCSLTNPVVNYPTYSYTVQNVAHELGHVMGLRHSHACVWNGNNTQIDDCGNVIATNTGKTPEGGGCYIQTNPILPGANGTIMSNCNQLPGQAISFTQGFGTIIGEALFTNFVNASCITGVNCSTLPPLNDNCIDAIPLNLSQTCSTRTYDNKNGSQSSSTPLFSCKSQPTYTDVWFTALIPSSGNLTIETSQVSGGFTDMIIQTYIGTCSSLTQLICNDNNGTNNHSRVVITGRPVGEKIFIRVAPNDVSGQNDFGEFGLCAFDSSVPCHPDFSALVNFYNSTGGSNWTNKSGWQNNSTNCNVCSWFGVVCNSENRVIALNLGSNNLTGNIPSTITGVTKLNRINLYSNNLGPSLPSFLSSLQALEYVDLGDNNYTGTIPISLASLVNLRTLFLDNNTLSGSIPEAVGEGEISVLWLNNNNLSGCLPKSFITLCERNATVRIDNNVLLPGGGNYNLFCQNGYGGDGDSDGYCAISQDCIDNDALSYPGAPELCDGKDNDCDNNVDEGVSTVANNWIGTNGDWEVSTNWSTGFAPKTCHDVVINPNVARQITIFNGAQSKAASVNLGVNTTLLIQNNAILKLENRGTFTNNGIINAYGNLTIANPVNANSHALENFGDINLFSTSFLNISNSGISSLRNMPGADFNNFGNITITGNSVTTGLYGIDNRGVFNNHGQITVEAINGREIRVASGSTFNNKIGSSLEVK
ncbi:MAG: hypothetical protein RLZZ546_1716 [Bacteroidota bacterium]